MSEIIGIKCNSYIENEFCEAAKNENISALINLLKEGVSVNAFDDFGRSALHYGVKCNTIIIDTFY